MRDERTKGDGYSEACQTGIPASLIGTQLAWYASSHYERSAEGAPFLRLPNGSDAKLHGQGLRAEASAARHLPRLTTSRQERDAGGVTRSGF